MRMIFTARLLAVVLGLVLLPTAAAGAIYQCEQNGRKIFSQQPCGADAKEVHSANADRVVALTANISAADIRYLCSLSMRAWEKQSEDRRNRSGSYYHSRSGNSEERRRAFVLSHISNLEIIAANDPELYDIAKSISGRSYGGDPESYLYDAERARAQKSCSYDVNKSIEYLLERRKSEDDHAFGKKKR
jgi:hypothetical protein